MATIAAAIRSISRPSSLRSAAARASSQAKAARSPFRIGSQNSLSNRIFSICVWCSVTGDHTFNQARIWMTRAARVRSLVWRVGSKRPGGDVEKWIDVIRIGLEGITVNDANKSFNGVYSRLEDMLDSLSTLLSENSVLNKDELLQLAFAAIQLVNSTRNY